MAEYIAIVDHLAGHTKEFSYIRLENTDKAFAFAEGSSIMLKVQAQKNTQRSETGILEGHFATREEALEWLEKEVHI